MTAIIQIIDFALINFSSSVYVKAFTGEHYSDGRQAADEYFHGCSGKIN